jgi:hypothetical protein
MALGANAGIADVAVGLAAGGRITPSGVDFSVSERTTSGERISAFLKAVVSECLMMARCTGKTNVHNLEPEDLRTTSLRASRTVGIAMAGTRQVA